jgi:hypothetical protein
MMPGDISECVEIIANHPVIGPRYGSRVGELQRVWLGLLGRDAIQTVVVRAGDGLHAPICIFGITLLVNDDFVREIKTPPLFWYGPELAKRVLRDDSPLLTDRQVREANSGEGVTLLNWEGCIRPGFENHNEISRWVLPAFIEIHDGFFVKEVISPQVESVARLQWTLKTGGLVWHPDSGRYLETLEKDANEIVREPHIVGITREIELGRREWWAGSSVGALFDYQSPQCGFSRSEQRMLLMAPDAGTDEDLSKRLGISLPTIKKTWLSIYRRAAEYLPKLNLDDSQSDSTERRGKEKKRRLLAYLREHLEELRPYSPRLLRQRDAGLNFAKATRLGPNAANPRRTQRAAQSAPAPAIKKR